MHALKESLRRVLDGQIAAAVAEDSTVADRHFRFLCAQLAVGAVGLAAFPLWLALGAPGSALASIAIVMLLAPLGVAAFVVRTGRIAIAQNVATAIFAVLVALALLATGGLSSPAVVLLAALPLSASIAGERPAIAVATAAAGCAFAVTAAVDLSGALGAPTDAIRALTAGAVGLAAIAVAAVVALRLAARGEGQEAAAAPVVAEPATDAPAAEEHDVPDAGLAADAGDVVASISSLTERLADKRVAAEPAELLQFERLMQAAARNAGIAGGAERPWPRIGAGKRPTADVAAAASAAIAANASLAEERGVRLHLIGDAPNAELTPAECTTLLASLVAAVLRGSRSGSNVLVALERRGAAVRVALRAGYASAKAPAPGQPFIQPQSPYTDAAQAAGLGLAEIGARARQSGGDLRLGPRGPGGLIAMLSLPAAEATLGVHRHAEESRNREVRKSA